MANIYEALAAITGVETPKLPNWLKPLDGKPAAFVADPDVFYPLILTALELDPESALRYDMEVALGLMKKVASRAARRHPHSQGRRGVTLLIRGDEGRKLRWGIAMFPKGARPDISSPLQTKERNQAVHAAWKRLFG